MLDNTKIKNIAKLAKLDVQNNIDEIATDLNNFLDLIDELQKVEVGDIRPMAHPFDSVQRLRADEVSETNKREELQQNAPLTENGHYLVPKVL